MKNAQMPTAPWPIYLPFSHRVKAMQGEENVIKLHFNHVEQNKPLIIRFIPRLIHCLVNNIKKSWKAPVRNAYSVSSLK